MLPKNKLYQRYDCQKGSDIWEQVEEIYEKKSSEGLIARMIRKLTEEMKAVEYRAGSNIGDHLTRFFIIRRQLKVYKYEVHDVNMIQYMVNSLPSEERFRTVRVITITPSATYTPDQV